MDRMIAITREAVEQARAREPKRICFTVTHTSEPKRTRTTSDQPFVGTINVPFGEGFEKLFPYPLFPNQQLEGAYWRGIKSEEEFTSINAWVRAQKARVFLRDCLYASVAMSHNFVDSAEGRERTEIGELEYQAKQNQAPDAVASLAACCLDTIRAFQLYREADLICAVPPSPGRDFDLPSRVASKVSLEIRKQDITENFSFGAPKRSVTAAALNEKWAVWDEAQVTFDGNLADKTVILIDDKYQSGTTIQYIAMKLQEAGVRYVLGLSMVKTMRDTDNQ